MKNLFIKILILFLPAGLFAQELSGLRERVFRADSDTVILDTARIVSGTIELATEHGQPVSDTLYTADPLNSRLVFDKGFPYRGKTLAARYRVYTLDPAMTASRKDTTIIIPVSRDDEFPRLHRYSPPVIPGDLWREETLMRSGSISRGVSFGNNQDVIVNSNLNLQLSGKLDDNINIVASISDQNIPLQPEGYSMQIHEFDRVFIQLYNDNLALTAGDFGVSGGGGILLPLERKAQGLQFSSVTEPDSGPFTEISNSATAAIARGRYTRNSFTGSEGNQGPYKLTGSNNELFIIVLAGSERVFVDGRLMTRGIDGHYVIDYNLAEITFTSNMPINKDRRIIVEFEYSDRNYSRYMLSNSTSLKTGNGNYFINIFSEHDAKNQPLLQELSEEETELLASVGDSLHRAWIPRVDSVEFRNDVVLYEKTDTIVNGVMYTIYRHSVDPDRAFYRPGFSRVGENRGNYRQVRSAANGRVFAWTAPVNGVPSGTHEPVTLLVTPRKQQVVSMGGSNRLTGNTDASFELAVSNNDMNTFSPLDNEDNIGMAFRTAIDRVIPLSAEGRSFAGGIDYEFAGSSFNTTERYKPPEYERDWNLSGLRGAADEHNVGWHAGYSGNISYARYRGEYLSLPGLYTGWRNSLDAYAMAAGFDGNLSLSYLNTATPDALTGFMRHEAELARPVWRLILGIRSEGEDNRREEKSAGTLLPSSFNFHQREVFLKNRDTATFHFRTAYREREDRLPANGRMEHYSLAREVSAGFVAVPAAGNRLSAGINHRTLEVGGNTYSDVQPAPTTPAKGKPENSLNGRLEADLSGLQGAIRGNLFYETGSGLEMKKDYMFIEVARGQGTHTWTDYNENGIKELDEFEPAAFPDQANYIRVMVPTDDFVRIRSGQFSQTLRLGAPPSWQDSNGVRRVVSLFSNNAAYQTGYKTSGSGLIGISPFHADLADSNLLNLSSSFRNNLSFRSRNRRFALEYLHQDNRSRNLLVNGLESRSDRSDALHGRYEHSPLVTYTGRIEAGTRISVSEYFPGRDFEIEATSARAGISVQPGHLFQTSLHIEHRKQNNRPGNETAEHKKLGAGLSYTVPSRGNITAGADYYYIEFAGRVNTPLAWEMLGGLRPGSNLVLNVQWQQTIAGNMQLSLTYNGRTSSGGTFIHTGGMQVRAYF